MQYEKVPYELKELGRWCCYKIVKRQGRETKMPVDAKTGNLAKSNDDSTWSDFDTAHSASVKFDGIGFFFKEPYIGIDIDDASSEIKKYLSDDHDDNIVDRKSVV